MGRPGATRGPLSWTGKHAVNNCNDYTVLTHCSYTHFPEQTCNATFDSDTHSPCGSDKLPKQKCFSSPWSLCDQGEKTREQLASPVPYYRGRSLSPRIRQGTCLCLLLQLVGACTFFLQWQRNEASSALFVLVKPVWIKKLPYCLTTSLVTGEWAYLFILRETCHRTLSDSFSSL